MALSTETTPVVRPQAVPGGFREMANLAYPVVLTQLSATAMGVVDTAMVGRLGATELASVGFGAIWLWTLFSLFYGTASGVQTFVSQADGAGESRACGRWVWQGLFAKNRTPLRVQVSHVESVLELPPRAPLLGSTAGDPPHARACCADSSASGQADELTLGARAH